MSRILVTGGRGFLGQVLTTELRAHGHTVTVLSRQPAGNNPAVLTADLRDRPSLTAALTDHRFDAVAHLAASTDVRESFTDPLGVYDVNVTGTLNLLSALTAQPEPPRIVYLSTQAVYGSTQPTPIPDTAPTGPQSPYAASKLAAEDAIGWHTATGRLAATIFRCSNLAGAAHGIHDGDAARLIPIVIRAARAGEPVHVNGDGGTIRDYLHVADAADAVIRALTTHAPSPGECRTLNLGAGHGATVTEIIAAVERVAGYPVKVEHRPPANEPRALVVNVDHTRQLLDWTPARSTTDRIITDLWTATTQPATP